MGGLNDGFRWEIKINEERKKKKKEMDDGEKFSKNLFSFISAWINRPIVGPPLQEKALIVTKINHIYATDIWLVLLYFIENLVFQPS